MKMALLTMVSLLAATCGNAQFTLVWPDTYSGSAGGADNARSVATDRRGFDVRLLCRPGAVLIQTQFPLEIVVVGTSPISPASVTELCLQVESQTDQGNITQIIEFYDYVNLTWRKIDERYGTPNSDTVVHADAKYDPSVFVESVTNQVKARIKYKAFTGTLIYPWQARLDFVRWEILD